MAKLYFKYGAMNCGKTTLLLQTAHNYEEQHMRCLIMKPSIDTKGEDTIVSRLGISRKVDKLINKDDNILEWFTSTNQHAYCLLVDEAQFLTKKQVDELYKIAVLKDCPVICYGLRTDFLNQGFPGSSRLLELAHSLQELKTICQCGAKATCNVRLVNGIPSTEGDQVAIDGEDEVEYISVCSKCYFEMLGERM